MKKICVLVAVLSALLFAGPPCGSAQLESQGISILREAEQLSKKANSREELEKALATYQQALEIFESTDSPRYKGEVLENIGSIYTKLGEYQKALEYYEKALGFWRKIGDVKRSAIILGNMGAVYKSLGKSQEALECYGKALDTWRIIEEVRKEERNLRETTETRASKRPVPPPAAAKPALRKDLHIAKSKAPKVKEDVGGTWSGGTLRDGNIGARPAPPAPTAPVSGTPSPPMDVSPTTTPEFPWPPPRASASIKIPTSLVLGQWGAPAGSPPPRRTSWQSYYYGEDVLLSLWQTGAPRLMHVDATLTTALSAAGYLEASYYSVPDGFALVTRLEQINPDGTPKPVPTRWEAQARLLEKFSLTGYCQALFSAKPGLFRIIVFVVTSHPFTESPEIVTREDAILWLCRGANVLPSTLAKQHYSAEHTCTALIYEFEKLDVETEAKVTVPGRLAADVHIEKSGIWGGIQR